MVTRRQFNFGAAAGLTGAALGAAGNWSAAGADPVTINLWGWGQGADIWHKAAADLTSQGVPVSIQYRASDPQQYGAVLQTALAGGEGPEVFYIGASSPAPSKFIATEQLEDITDIVDPSTMNPDYYRSSMSNGRTYSVPMGINSYQWFYNKDLYAQAGLQLPKTWDQLIANCEKFASMGITPIAAMGQGAYGQSSVTWTKMGIEGSILGREYILDLLAGRRDFTDPRMVALFQKMQELTKYYQPNWLASGTSGNEMETLFATGRSAMLVSGIWELDQNFSKINPKLNVGVFLSPTLTAEETPYDGWSITSVIGVRKGIKDPAKKTAAEAIIKYTTSKAFGQLWLTANSQISPMTGVKKQGGHPVMAEVSDWLLNNGVPSITGTGSPFMEAPVNTGTDIKASATMLTASWSILPALMRGEITPDEAAKRYQDQLSWYFKK